MKHAVCALLLLPVASYGAGGELIDRIAVRVGATVITQSEIVRDLRITAFLDGRPAELNPDTMRKAAERLVERALIRREMDANRYPPAQFVEANHLLDQIKGRFANEDAFRSSLAEYEIREDDVRDHLLLQLTTLRFIEYRFRPAIQVPARDIETYYETVFLPQAGQNHAERIPPLDEVRGDIEKILTNQRVDQSLERWLQETRLQVDIEFRDEVFS
ncbi:MAG TPA: hypothetical protein VFQ79_04990 [Bryobacteraceae bacterium]|nr:hypothetical protein [Bryobacteraceae bacterium]